jgi:hypothetical protein
MRMLRRMEMIKYTYYCDRCGDVMDSQYTATLVRPNKPDLPGFVLEFPNIYVLNVPKRLYF